MYLLRRIFMVMDTYMRKFKFSLQDHGQITQIAMGEEGGGLRKNLFADGVQAPPPPTTL